MSRFTSFSFLAFFLRALGASVVLLATALGAPGLLAAQDMRVEMVGKMILAYGNVCNITSGDCYESASVLVIRDHHFQLYDGISGQPGAQTIPWNGAFALVMPAPDPGMLDGSTHTWSNGRGLVASSEGHIDVSTTGRHTYTDTTEDVRSGGFNEFNFGIEIIDPNNCILTHSDYRISTFWSGTGSLPPDSVYQVKLVVRT